MIYFICKISVCCKWKHLVIIDCDLHCLCADGNMRELKMDSNFFVSYRKTALTPSEILLSVLIPYSKEVSVFVSAYVHYKFTQMILVWIVYIHLFVLKFTQMSLVCFVYMHILFSKFTQMSLNEFSVFCLHTSVLICYSEEVCVCVCFYTYACTSTFICFYFLLK